MNKRLTLREMILDALINTLCVFIFIVKTKKKIQYSIEYKYASHWNVAVSLNLDESLIGGNINQSKELTSLLNNCKEMVYSTNMEEVYPELAWDKLDTVSIWYYDYTPQRPDNLSVLGEYLGSKNYIVVTPLLLEQEDLSIKYGCIIHEIMHALFSNVTNHFQLQEGVADYFTTTIAELNGLSYSSSAYIEETRFWLMIGNIWGTKNCVDMLLNDTLNQNIDQLTVDGFGKKFEGLLYCIRNYNKTSVEGTIGDYYDKDDLIMMAQDIICHATRNYAKSMKDENDKESMLKFCRDALIIPDDYFLEMLK